MVKGYNIYFPYPTLPQMEENDVLEFQLSSGLIQNYIFVKAGTCQLVRFSRILNGKRVPTYYLCLFSTSLD